LVDEGKKDTPLSLGHSIEEVTLVKLKGTRENENGFVPCHLPKKNQMLVETIIINDFLNKLCVA
jgi:hypothetical protein